MGEGVDERGGNLVGDKKMEERQETGHRRERERYVRMKL